MYKSCNFTFIYCVCMSNLRELILCFCLLILGIELRLSGLAASPLPAQPFYALAIIIPNFYFIYFETSFSYIALTSLGFSLLNRLDSHSEICMPLHLEFWG